MASNLEKRALRFATRAHGTQVRKYTGEPYINHPRAVYDLVRLYIHTPEVRAAALLHDVVEDTPVTLEDIRAEFGEVVASFVEQVTDVSRPEDGNRSVRKLLDLKHLEKASFGGKSIKLADLIDNTSSITKYDPEFSKTYMKEKVALLEVLKGGHPDLWMKAAQIAVAYFAKEDISIKSLKY